MSRAPHGFNPQLWGRFRERMRQAHDAGMRGDEGEADLGRLLDFLDDEISGLGSRVAELETALDDVALESVRLHERQAEERRDITAALEWRVEAQRLENMLGSFE